MSRDLRLYLTDILIAKDILAHAYFQIEDEIIWDVVQNKIPALLGVVSQLLEGMS